MRDIKKISFFIFLNVILQVSSELCSDDISCDISSSNDVSLQESVCDEIKGKEEYQDQEKTDSIFSFVSEIYNYLVSCIFGYTQNSQNKHHENGLVVVPSESKSFNFYIDVMRGMIDVLLHPGKI